MTSEKLYEQFGKLNVWKRGGERAPHKPLLLLLAIGYLQRGQQDIPYAEIHDQLKGLLEDYGPPRKVIHPEYPFVRMVSDGIWELSDKSIEPGSDPSAGTLVKHGVLAGFKPMVFKLLSQDRMLQSSIIQDLLESNFPESLHEDILLATGVTLGVSTSTRKIRDPRFRELILEAYGYRCAVCGVGIRLRNSLVAIEAAHIKWHQAGGPDTIENGMALCSLHHKLLDVGAFTVDEQLRMLVSARANGYGLEEALLDYHGKMLQTKLSKSQYPEPDFLAWHVNEVFKQGYRPIPHSPQA